MKRRSKTLGVTIAVIFVLSVGVSSGRADSLYEHRDPGDMNHGQQIKLDLFNLAQEEAVGYLQHPNNGKHPGFSVASVRQGPTLDVVGYYDRAVATPTPEPATMILFGSGLLAVGAYARKKTQLLK